MTTELLEPELQAAAIAPAPPRKARSVEWLPPALFAATLLFQVARAWRKSFDPIIDFGRELYTPWQLAQGKNLYTDIAAFYGPLSQYTNALAFKLFGPTLTTLLTLNVLILTVATTLLYLLLRNVTNILAATVGTLLFIVMFGTAHIGAVGNFNFLTPYSHEATHGITLSLAALLAFIRYTKTHNPAALALAAGLAGGVLMTKPEIALALVGSLTAGFALHVWSTGFSLKGNDQAKACTPKTLLLAAGALLLPLVLMAAFLTTRSPFFEALKQTFGAYLFVPNGDLVQSRFFAASMGLEDPADHFTRIGLTTLRYIAILLPPFLAALFLRRLHPVVAACVGFALALIARSLLGLEWWKQAGEILLLSTLLTTAITVCTTGISRKSLTPKIPLLTLAAFSLLILLKMLFYNRFHQYGFILAILPTMLLTIALLDLIPGYLARRKANPWGFRLAALVVLAMLANVALTVSARNLAEKHYTLSAGANTFNLDERARIFAESLNWLQQNSRDSDTLTVFPEGLILNVLSHRPTPIPYLSAIPSDITMFGEQKILASLQKKPPTFIAITHRLTFDFGPGSFGTDYALDLRNWISQNYHPAHLAGPIPFTSNDFGILILQRNR